MGKEQQPTVFHITHWKAGSQWVMAVLAGCAPTRIVKPKVGVAQVYNDPLIPGAIYPTTYIPRPRFESILTPSLDLDPKVYTPSPSDGADVQNWYNFKVNQNPVIKFVVIRDLRDTLVSLYYSLKVSHPVISEKIAEGRQALNDMSFEDGFLYILNSRGKANANIQRSWLPACKNGQVMLIRYEDLILDEENLFTKISEYCKIDVSPTKLKKIISENSFKNKTGRQPGQEDITSHHRKGIVGDWKNNFTDRINSEFKKQFGQLLIDTGYEKDLNW